MNDIYEMMSTLRAVRKLRTDPIPDDVLERVLQASAWAPTGGNVQPWRVIVVRSPQRKQALADIYKPEWYDYLEGFKQRIKLMPEDQQPMWERTMLAGNHLADHLHEAPVILMFIADPGLEQIAENVQRLCVAGFAFQKGHKLFADLWAVCLEMQVGDKMRCHSIRALHASCFQ